MIGRAAELLCIVLAVALFSMICCINSLFWYARSLFSLAMVSKEDCIELSLSSRSDRIDGGAEVCCIGVDCVTGGTVWMQ